MSRNNFEEICLIVRHPTIRDPEDTLGRGQEKILTPSPRSAHLTFDVSRCSRQRRCAAYCIPSRRSRVSFRLPRRYRRPVQRRNGGPPPFASPPTRSSKRQSRRSLRPSSRLSLQRSRLLESRPLGLVVRAELTLSRGTVSWPAPPSALRATERGTKKVTVWDHIGHRDLGG